MFNKIKRINNIIFEDVDTDKLKKGFEEIKEKIPTTKKEFESLQTGLLHYGVEMEQIVKNYLRRIND
jgi:hypothetical protein